MVLALALAVTQQQPNFGRLFPRPSGANGYEDYVRAGDALRLSKSFSDFEAQLDSLASRKPETGLGEGGASDYLTLQKREAEAFSNVRRWIEEGNQKTISDPRTQFTAETSFPEFNDFRLIARLETHSAYAEFADGKTSEGLKTLIDCLTFGKNLCTNSFLSRVVGAECEASAMAELDRHLDELSLNDARNLEGFALASAREPPGIQCLPLENQWAESTIQKYLDATPPDLGSKSEALVNTWEGLSKEQQGKEVSEVRLRIRDAFQSCRALLTGPESRWIHALDENESRSPLSSLQSALLESSGAERVIRSLIRLEAINRVQIHLIYLNAMVVEYRWVHGTLPKSLAQSVSPEELNDEVCGSRFIFEASEPSYILKSKGFGEVGEITLSTKPVPESPPLGAKTP